MEFRTEQDAAWAGSFGDEYTTRNAGPSWLPTRIALFSRILAKAPNVQSILELGAGDGLNLIALKTLGPQISLSGVEINEQAYRRLSAIEGVSATRGSLLDHDGESADLVLTFAVLVHVASGVLEEAYEKIYSLSRRYILVAEYYNPTPVSIPYRGYTDRLSKRDWAGDMMDRFPDLRLVDYGFVYHRDPVFPDDDVTWFLLEKAPR